MNSNYDSYLEIAVALMKKKKGPKTLDAITKEVFAKKGVTGSEMQIAQFQVDFMLSGYFVYIGNDQSDNPLWDLKNRQKFEFIDKDGGYAKEETEEDEEVKNNELTEENLDETETAIEEDEEETPVKKDDVEDDLTEMGYIVDGEETEDVENIDLDEDEDLEDEDDIEEELSKINK